jgi:hypothetical protein
MVGTLTNYMTILDSIANVDLNFIVDRTRIYSRKFWFLVSTSEVLMSDETIVLEKAPIHNPVLVTRRLSSTVSVGVNLGKL